MARKRPRGTGAPRSAPGAAETARRGAGVVAPARDGGPLPLLLWVTLALLVGARAALTFAPAMWAWSLNLMRFLHPALGWGLWALAALALVPPLARRAVPAWSAAGDLIARRPALAAALAALLAAGLAWLTPDHVRFVGDFLLRQGTVAEAAKPAELFPQALPLDLYLHYSLPRFIADSELLDANGAARAIGLVEVAALAGLATAFARALALTGAPAVAAASVLFFGGYLGLFTGFSKAFAEMCLLVAIVGVYGLRTIRDGRGLLVVGLALAAGVTLHRSALGLAPAAALAWGLWFAAHGRGGGWRRPGPWIAAAAPLVTIAIMVPRILAIVRRWDPEHFTPPAMRQAGLLGAAFAGARPADLLNLMVLLSPLALLAPALLPALRRRLPAGSGRELAFLALVALPFAAVMPFLHPAQGLFRDWDDFAAGGVAVSLLAAWAAGQALRILPPRHAWLAVAVTLSAAVPTAQWLAHHVDQERGFARVRAFMSEPPSRTPAERGTTWDYLGVWAFNLERWDQAAEAFERAGETSPSPRILQERALAETMRKNYAVARDVYHRMLEKAPDNALGWLGLATVSLNLYDTDAARRAAGRLLELQPGNPDAMRVLREADQMDAMRQGRGGAPP